jgi:hypothetical protein
VVPYGIVVLRWSPRHNPALSRRGRVTQFHTRGPVPLDSGSYIDRTFEQNVERFMLQRRWVLLLGPRQHGKTSALFRVKKRLVENGFSCTYIDLQALPPHSTYRDLLRWFAERVARELETHREGPLSPEDSDDLLSWLATVIEADGKPVAIIVDEASGISNDAWRNSFFGQLRAIANASATAQPGALERRLQFTFSGTFRPEALVDQTNSPFNVCEPVQVEDLTEDEVWSLARTVFGEDENEDLGGQTFRKVGGQPYLVQSLLACASEADPAGRAAAIEAEFDRLQLEGNDHLDSLFEKVFREPRLREIVAQVADAGAVQNEPANNDFRFLVTLGLLKREGARLVFRNTLYEEISRKSPQLRPQQATTAIQPIHLFHQPDSTFDFIRDDRPREIVMSAHAGAINAYQSGNYRLCLVAFGMALEAILIAWLEQHSLAERKAAVAAARAKPNVTLATVPVVWTASGEE